MITLTKTLQFDSTKKSQYVAYLGKKYEIFKIDVNNDGYGIWEYDTGSQDTDEILLAQGKSSDILLWIENRYAEFFAEEFPEVTLNFIWE
jgi:hypothetical protein